MKVLVTGALGQLGRAVIHELALRGLEGVGTDLDKTESAEGNVPSSKLPFSLILADICDTQAVHQLVQEVQPDAIVHCAAWTDVDGAEDPANKQLVRRINVDSTRNVAQAASNNGASMLFISTDYVFNGGGETPWQPQDACEPLNYYGQTKLEGEQALVACLDKHFIVRISWLFGPNGRNFVDSIAKAGQTRDEVRVVNDQVGTPTYAPDLARLLVDLVQTDAYGTYHATNAEAQADGYISWYEFAQEVWRISGCSARLVGVSTEEYGISKAKRPSNSRLDKTALREAGIDPLPDWKDALRRHLSASKNEEGAGDIETSTAESPLEAAGPQRLRVLWITHACSLQDDADNPSLCARHEFAVAKHASNEIQLALAYMADGQYEAQLVKDGITYYAVDADMTLDSTPEDWDKARSQLLAIVDDFKPDVIHCFGAEWPYGAIAQDVDTPVVVHMMGFLNAYFPAIDMVRGAIFIPEPVVDAPKPPKGRLHRLLHAIKKDPEPESEPEPEPDPVRFEEILAERERAVMAANHHFLGRTAWDRSLVEHFAPGAAYYHVPEAVKQAVYDAAGQWRFHHQDKTQIITLARADERKGINIVLHTAHILHDVLNLDFEWRLAAQADALAPFDHRQLAPCRVRSAADRLPGASIQRGRRSRPRGTWQNRLPLPL